MTTLIIDEYEQLDVAILNFPGAYFKAELAKNDNNECALMRIEGDFVT